MFRGFRGCPLSCLIFIICTEFMTLSLKQSDKIKGIQLGTPTNKKELRITQYADDTCLFLKDLQQIQPSLDIINTFSTVSGLTLNITKTEGITLGTLPKIPINYDHIKWPQGHIRYLGVYLGHNDLENNTMNWESKIETIQKLLDSWRTRKLTLFGKILIIKSLALPKLVYPASILPLPSDIIKRVNTLFFKFIWGKSEKIKRNVLTNEYYNGGLKMIDLESHFNALKAAWMTRLKKDSDLIWTFLPHAYINKCTNGMALHMSFKDKTHFPRLKMIPIFYQEVISAYCKSNNLDEICTKESLFNQFIWGNRFLQANQTSLFSNDFISAGYLYIKDILNENGKFKDNIYQNLNCKRQYLRTISMLQCALKPYKHIRFSNEPMHFENKDLDISSKTSNSYYKAITRNKPCNTTMIQRWCITLDEEIDWSSVYERKIKNQFEMKISEFNYKLQHDILPTKYNLYKWKISQDETCIYCAYHQQNAKHMLFECRSIGNVWHTISNVLNINIEWKTIVVGIEHSIFNKIISLVSYMIYKKYLIDKDKSIQSTLTQFLCRDIKFRTQEYPLTICDIHTKNLLNDIISRL